MLRPAIEETVTEFEKREGVRVSRVYNGCGILATQPFAVSKETRLPQLTARLFERLCSAESRDLFEAEGFRWQLK